MSIRTAHEEDIPRILAIYAPYVENTAVSFAYTVPTIGEFTKRFRQITKQFPFLVWQEDGRVLGYAYADAPFEREAFSWCAELSVYLAPEAQGRGIGRKLYTRLEEILEKQGYAVLYALVTTDNAPSAAFHRAMGYRQVGYFPDCGWKRGKWHGLLWLEKRLKTVEMMNNFPISFREIGEI